MINIVDQKALTGHRYQIEFFDTSTDGIDNDKDWNIQTDDIGSDGMAGTNDEDGTENNCKPDQGEPNLDWLDNDEYMPITTLYNVRDLDRISEIFIPNDTFSVQLNYKKIIKGSVEVKNSIGNTISDSDYIINHELGRIKARSAGSMSSDNHTITFNYFPIYRNP